MTEKQCQLELDSKTDGYDPPIDESCEECGCDPCECEQEERCPNCDCVECCCTYCPDCKTLNGCSCDEQYEAWKDRQREDD